MISILMPIYNGIEFINESVKSVLNQTYKDWELIIGINGHPENSDVFKIAKQFENCDKIKVYDLIGIKGKSNALNKMLEYCKYNWICLLDVDDFWIDQKLEYQIPFIANYYDVIGSPCYYFGDKVGISPIPVKDITDFDFFSVNPIINSSCLVKKELCYWDSQHDGVEDYDLWLKLKKQNKRFYNYEFPLVFHRIHKSSSFNNSNYLAVEKLLEKHK